MAQGWKQGYFRYKSYFLNILNVYRQKEDFRMYLEIFLSLAAVSLFGIFAIKPTFFTISQLVKDVRSKKETIQIMDEKISKLQKAQQILNQNSTLIPIVSVAVPSYPQPDLLIQQLGGLASANSINLMGISVGETLIKGPLDIKKIKATGLPEGSLPMNFSVSISGEFQNILSFLTGLEKLRIPVKVDVLGISTTKTTEVQTINMVVSGKVPYLEAEK